MIEKGEDCIATPDNEVVNDATFKCVAKKADSFMDQYEAKTQASREAATRQRNEDARRAEFNAAELRAAADREDERARDLKAD